MRARGIDISTHQEIYDPSVFKHDFVFIRSTYNIYPDERFTQHAESIAEVPVRGAYHYFSSYAASTDELFWQKQADKYMEVVKEYDFDLYILDFERKHNEPSMRFGAGAKKWLDYVAEQSGKPVILYSNPASYQEYLLPYGQRWMNDYPFWVAQYPYDRVWNERLTDVFSISGGWEPRLPAGHTEWKFWQFSADGNQKGPENGLVRRVWHLTPPAIDLDVFNGTVQDLMDWLNKEHVEVEEDNEDELIDTPPTEPPPVEQPQTPTYAGMTNQNMIDLFYRAAKPFATDYWNHWIKNAGLEYLAVPEENRGKPYTGPKIEDLPGLTNEEKNALLAAM